MDPLPPPDEVIARFDRASAFRLPLEPPETLAPMDPESLIDEATRDMPKEAEFAHLNPGGTEIGADYVPEEWGTAFRDAPAKPEPEAKPFDEHGSIARRWDAESVADAQQVTPAPTSAGKPKPSPEQKSPRKNTDKDVWDEMSRWVEE